MTNASPAIRDSRSAIWFGGVFVLLLVGTLIATTWSVHSLSTDFDSRSQKHLAGDVQQVRERVTRIETYLDAAAERVRARLIADPKLDRPALFRILREQVT